MYLFYQGSNVTESFDRCKIKVGALGCLTDFHSQLHEWQHSLTKHTSHTHCVILSERQLVVAFSKN